ncbi:MAG TPA: outer membrane protein assembly factor BamA [Syntrophorhabdales bacterium]|nr:outer membrane protein assembly factor BamA [Syntrophorhabdales bacterium]
MRHLLFSVLFCTVFTTLLFAQENGRIAKIDVVGTERIDKGVVTNAIKSREGDVYDPAKIGEDLKSIYKTGYFSDVMVDVKDTDKGKAVSFVVVERPPVNAIYITGNKKVKTEDIRDKLKIKIGAILNLEKVNESIAEIKRLYASKGYYAAKVSYEVETEEGYRTGLRFVIEEPEKAYVRKITFSGNDHLKAKDIKSVMKTQEKGIFSWFTGSGLLDEEGLEDDRKQIEGFYHDHGYVRVKVGRPDVTLSKDGKTISISIPLEEGNEYKVGEITFKGDIVFDEDEIRKKFKSQKGKTFRSSLFQDDITTITDLYQDQGYAFADIAPLTSIDDESRLVNVDFDIARGSEVYFNRINIVGNIRTRDKVVRRELKVAEGDLYSSSKLKESKRKLTNTTYFKSVDLKTPKTDEPDLVNMDVLVEEKPTGTLSLGVGYSTYEKAMVTGGISQENIMGTGQKVFLNASLSSITHLYDLTYVQPYTFDTNISSAFNVFNTEWIFSTYRFSGDGGSITESRPITDYLSASLSYRYEDYSVTRVAPNASEFLLRQQGSSVTSSITPGLYYNSIDNVLNPMKGTVASISEQIAGGPLLGDNKFSKTVVSWGRYFPWKYDTTFFLRGTAGTAREYGGVPVPIYDNFFVGGIDTNRGFNYGAAGTLDPNTGDVLGSTNELFFNAEWIFNIFKPAGLKGDIFFDYGKGFDTMNGFVEALRPAAGFGLRWYSPMGPIRVELGFNLDRKTNLTGPAREPLTVFNFSMGKPF